MKVTYVDHSGYVVEYGEIVLIFDYVSGELPEFNVNSHIYVFVSHKHRDHFSLDIFRMYEKYKNIKFIISNDAKVNAKYLERYNISGDVLCNVIFASKNIDIDVDGSLKVTTLKSNDAGVAYLVYVEDKVIYHAGDLNWWTSEDSAREDEQMYNIFTQGIDRLKGIAIDIAFLPLDMRLGDRFYYGFDFFLRHTSVAIVFPMHFFGDYRGARMLIDMDISEPYRDRVQIVEYNAQEFVFE